MQIPIHHRRRDRLLAVFDISHAGSDLSNNFLRFVGYFASFEAGYFGCVGAHLRLEGEDRAVDFGSGVGAEFPGCCLDLGGHCEFAEG